VIQTQFWILVSCLGVVVAIQSSYRWVAGDKSSYTERTMTFLLIQ